jgi:hypothetical protein
MFGRIAAFASIALLSSSCVTNAVEIETETSDVVSIPVEPYVPTWKCPDCTPNEKYVLEQLQKKTRITDRNALATIMGNIKQESKFIPNICEGGAPEFKDTGKTVQQYMVPAYYWLGWGIKGNREIYSYNYTKKLVLA